MKGASVLLIAAFLIFSTVAVTANTNEQNPTITAEGQGQGPASIQPIIWDNGMDYEGMGASQWDPSFNFDPICADDFILEEPDNTIHDVHWMGGYWNGPPDDGDFDWEVTFYEDRGDGNAPGAIIWQHLYPNAEVSETFIEGTPGGSNFYSYSVILADPLTVTPGAKYWISVQGHGAFPPQSGFCYHSTILLHMGVFKSAYFGFPDWTDSQVVFGTAYDFAFQLTGEGEPAIPNLDCEGVLEWDEVVPGETVVGEFDVMNVGEPMSYLNWEIESCPEWGNWTFDPESGVGLGEGETTTVAVEVEAPGDENTEFTGEVKVVNSEDPDDFCIIDVTLVTPYEVTFFDFLMQRFPFLAWLLELLF